MDSKTAKAVDKSLVAIEKEIARLRMVMAAWRNVIQEHYTKKPKA